MGRRKNFTGGLTMDGDKGSRGRWRKGRGKRRTPNAERPMSNEEETAIVCGIKTEKLPGGVYLVNPNGPVGASQLCDILYIQPFTSYDD
jgi:hypothetical protein